MYSLLEASRLLDRRLVLRRSAGRFRFRTISSHPHVGVGGTQLHPVQRPEVAPFDGRDADDLDLRPRLTSALPLHDRRRSTSTRRNPPTCREFNCSRPYCASDDDDPPTSCLSSSPSRHVETFDISSPALIFLSLSFSSDCARDRFHLENRDTLFTFASRRCVRRRPEIVDS